jgi:hypothetical protein
MKDIFSTFNPSFPILFIAGWILVSFIMSRMGWRQLAKQYRTKRRYSFGSGDLISARINWIRYKRCLMFIHDMEGMYLRPMILFRLFHPPIFIPWREMSEEGEIKPSLIRFVLLTVGTSPITNIELDRETFLKIKQHFYPGRDARFQS